MNLKNNDGKMAEEVRRLFIAIITHQSKSQHNNEAVQTTTTENFQS
jgi:hypothetical protein